MIHLKRRILTRGNLLGYEKLSKEEIYGAPKENHKERKRTRSCFGYVALLCDFIDKELSNYEEAVEMKEWKDDEE